MISGQIVHHIDSSTGLYARRRNIVILLGWVPADKVDGHRRLVP